MEILNTILTSPRTVITPQWLTLVSGTQDRVSVQRSLMYYARKGTLGNPRKGIYTKHNYNEQEMACSLFRPAYISLEYVLQLAGVVFQYDDTITCISYLNRIVEIDDKTYRFRIINPELWIGMEGIEQHDNILIATPERAFLDMVYLSAGNCYFDNLHPLNKTKVKQLLPLYQSKVLTMRATELLNLK